MTAGAGDGSSTRVVERPDLSGYGIEWAAAGRLIASRGDWLFELGAGSAPRRLGRFPQPAWQQTVTRSRLAQRALRAMYYNVLPLPGGDLFVTFARSVGVVRQDGTTLAPRGLTSPCRVLRGGCAIAGERSVFFGEYHSNENRGPMRVYRYRSGADTIEVAHTFAAGSIRHVHGVFADPFGPGLWCTTGDRGGECRISHSEDEFRSVRIVGGGDESWRAVSLQFSADAIYYAMDAEFTQNYIYRVDRRSGRRDELQAIEGPVYYSARRGDDLYFAVTAELCPSQQGKFAAIWHVNARSGAATRLATFPKDRLPVRYFMPGTIDFSGGDGASGVLFFRLTGLVPDGRVYAIV